MSSSYRLSKLSGAPFQQFSPLGAGLQTFRRSLQLLTPKDKPQAARRPGLSFSIDALVLGRFLLVSGVIIAYRSCVALVQKQ